MHYFKNGGLHFIRVYRLQLSFCICKRRRWVMPAILDCHDYQLATPYQYAAMGGMNVL